MSENLIESFNMDTNFEGLIQLLAKSLYSEPDIFIRELVQNSHDSIVRRNDIEKNHSGKIDIKCDHQNNTITIIDNGIGMNKDDIKNFLSVIGSTGTGTIRKSLREQGVEAAYNLIGQFGIGMLSAFVVADKVIVNTLKYDNTDAFSWHNSGTTECKLYKSKMNSIGSEIIVFVNEQYSYLIDREKIEQTIIKYCDFIPIPILLDTNGPINTLEAPWHRKHWKSEEDKSTEYRHFLNRRYSDYPMDIIPIDIDKPYKAKGVLYISDRHILDVNTAGVIDIFVRRMFIRSNDNTFLPKWAKFIRGVIDSYDLEPTASREDIKRKGNKAFEFLQKYIEDIIINRLTYLAENEHKKFRRISRWHHNHIKGMAYFQDDFFNKVAEMLLFETNKGAMPLEEYLAKNEILPNGKAPVYYFSYHGATAQFYRLANAQGRVVIDAGHSFDEEILRKYSRRKSSSITLIRLDESDDQETFQRLDASEQEHFQKLELYIERILRHSGLTNIKVQMRKFLPPELPSVIIITPETEAEEKLRKIASGPWWLEEMEDIANEVLDKKQKTIYLSINASNILIKRMADTDLDNNKFEDICLGLYNIAILYSQNLLTKNNANVIHGQVIRLLERDFDLEMRLENTISLLEEERKEVLEFRKKELETLVSRPEHIRLFMITPFDNKYKTIERIIRSIFERSPYFFEVKLARDYVHNESLLNNIREHISLAHGFIAEITDQKPNVMFELGAVMMPNDGRPVFTLRRSDATLPVPADFKEKLFITYGSLSNPQDDLIEEIRNAFEKDGRIIHEGIIGLIEQRKKRFLSRELLENLRIKLNHKDIQSIMKKYLTIEDLISISPKNISNTLNLEEYIAIALHGELKAL